MTTEAIRLQELSYTYPDGSAALSGVSLSIAEGERVAIVGPNGAGKSTLLLHLNGILGANGGVTIFGVEARRRNLPEIRRSVGLVFQDPDDQLFMPSVFEDVAFGPLHMGLSEEEVRERVAKALLEVGLEGYEEKVPHHLSDGEKRAVAIATALSMEPRILVLDEPSSNLDPRARRSLIGLLKSLTQTQVIASHDLEMILEVCARCVLIDEGRLIGSGKTREILSDAALMERHGLEVPHSIHHLGGGDHDLRGAPRPDLDLPRGRSDGTK